VLLVGWLDIGLAWLPVVVVLAIPIPCLPNPPPDLPWYCILMVFVPLEYAIFIFVDMP